MNTVSTAIRRECRVAFSRRAQPVWFRIVKWTCILTSVALFHGQRWFWWTLAGLVLAGCCMHIFYRCKTKIWTCTWGGWNDLAAGRD